MFPQCHLKKNICCIKCSHYGVCYKNCLFQPISCNKCNYKNNNKDNKKDKGE